MYKFTLLLILVFIGYFKTYSQQTTTWTEINTLSPPPANHVHQLINYSNSEVFMFGGSYNSDEPYIYNHNSMTWSKLTTSNTPSQRLAHSLAKLNNDKILMYGGNGFEPIETWIFDIPSSSWTELNVNVSSTYLSEASMVNLGENKVLLFGGTRGGGVNSTDETWIFEYEDDNSYTWTKLDITSSPSKRYAHQLARINDNKAILFGGIDEDDVSLDDTWIFDYTSKSWTEISTSSTPPARNRFSMSQITDNLIFLFGYTSSSVWLFNIEEETWTELNNISPNPGERRSYTSAQIGEGKVIIYSGSSQPADTWVFSLTDSPEVSNVSLVNTSNNSATLTSNITVNASSTTVTYESGTISGSYSTTSTPVVLAEDDAVLVVLDDLENGLEYFIRVRAENSVSLTYSSEFSFTFQNVPLNHSATFTLARNEITKLVFNIESLNSLGADGYLILYNQGSSFTGEPEDGGNYSVGGTIDDATIGAIITDVNDVEATINGLTKDVQYHIKIYPFNWNGIDITSAVYKTDGVVPSLTVVTVPTLGEWGMIAFVSLMAFGGVFYIKKRIV